MAVGSGVKQKKQMAKFTTSEAQDQPLEQTIRSFLECKHAQGQFMLQKGSRKYEAIVECVATGPRIHGSAWEQHKVVQAFVDAGFIDRTSKTCPDIYQMMTMCGIDFEKNRLRREAFMPVIAEHVQSGYVSEEFFDSLGVAVDMDAHGREYPLTATSDIRSRARQLSTQARIQQICAEMIENLEKARQKQRALLDKARSMFQLNTAAEEMVQHLANRNHDGQVEQLSFDDLATLGTKHLSLYYHVRVCKDATIKPTNLQKGKPEPAAEGTPCLLFRVKEVLGKEVVASMPQLDPPQIPKALEVPETVFDINNSNKISDFAPTVEWCDEAALVIHPISTNGKLEHLKSHLTGLDEEATIQATKVQARMKHFLIGRYPSKLMNHWVWASFTANFVKPVACLAVLADLQSRALEYATTVESYLNNNNSVFPTVDSDNEKLDGCYLTLDTVRGDLI
jgi:hypothetical protein